MMIFLFKRLAQQQEDVEDHTARCHPRRWFGGRGEGEAAGRGKKAWLWGRLVLAV